MDEAMRNTILEVVEDAMYEIDELEHALITTITQGSEIEAVQGFRRMVIERLTLRMKDEK